MEHMAIKSTQKPMSAFKAAQQPSIVSYFLPSPFTAPDPTCIYIEETRNLLAARGTTGLRVWDTCLHLAYYLSTEGSDLIKGKNVLELGAGTGLLSILCAGPLNASMVISTDGDADVVESIASNAKLNLDHLPAVETKLTAKVLDWTDESSLPEVLQHNGKQLPLGVILGADITYDAESLEPLVHIIGALHKIYPKLDIIISTVIRNEDTYASFVSTCAEASFSVSIIQYDCPPLDQQTGFFHKLSPPICIVRLSRDLATVKRHENS